MPSIKPKLRTIQNLLGDLRDGCYAIPKLQREFVWTGSKAAKLLDSIYREMPIGTLVIWKTSSRYESVLRRSRHVIPPFNSANREILFLIDGQQRLSVLHNAFTGDEVAVNGGPRLHFKRVAFDVRRDTDGQSSRFSYRLPVEGEFVSVSDILASDWRSRLRRLPQYKLRRAEECRRRILQYRVPILQTETTDLEEVRELFIRINTQGMRISSADAAFARASTFDLRQSAQELRDQLPEAFRTIPYQTILQALAFVQGVRDVGERSYSGLIDQWTAAAEDGAAKKDILPDWARLRRAFELAVEYLRTTFVVVDQTVLPSDNMLATLCVYFYHHRGQPRTAARREIRKWFWATAVGTRYSGRGYRENLVRDCDFFRRLARGRGRFTNFELVDRYDVRRAEYNRRTSLTDAYFCMLALRNPRFIETGGALPRKEYASRINRENRHHIFPRARLIRAGISPREYNSICNICLTSQEENLSFSSRLPRVYLAEARRKRHFKSTMRSHLIPAGPESGLWHRDIIRGFRDFRDARRDLICDAFEEMSGTRLFQKA